MRATIQKWGNSLAIRIPKSLAVESEMEENSQVDLRISDGKIVIKVRSAKPKYSLDEMLAQITDENIHPETDWGPPVGREIL